MTETATSHFPISNDYISSSLSVARWYEPYGKVVGYAEPYRRADGSYGEITRWGRTTAGIYAGDEQWYAIEPLHDKRDPHLIRAKRIHTIMPEAY